jgi:hypothetical protein
MTGLQKILSDSNEIIYCFSCEYIRTAQERGLVFATTLQNFDSHLYYSGLALMVSKERV